MTVVVVVVVVATVMVVIATAMVLVVVGESNFRGSGGSDCRGSGGSDCRGGDGVGGNAEATLGPATNCQVPVIPAFLSLNSLDLLTFTRLPASLPQL